MFATLERFSWTVDADNANASWRMRHGLLLRLEDEDGRVGWGEASPLPGYSPQTLAECESALRQVTAALNESRPVEPLVGAAAFAFETASFDLEAQQEDIALASLLGAPDGARLEISTLLPGLASPLWLDAAEEALARGFRVLKAKVGAPGRLDDEVTLLSILKRQHGDRILLRLDANGALPDDDALAAFAPIGPEFIEEPSASWTRLSSSPVVIAADETLATRSGEALVLEAISRGVCGVVVLKPALLGLKRSLELASTVKAAGARVVVTHLHDGPVGRAAAAAFALAVCDETLACGLERAPGIDGRTLSMPDAIGLGVVP